MAPASLATSNPGGTATAQPSSPPSFLLFDTGDSKWHGLSSFWPLRARQKQKQKQKQKQQRGYLSSRRVSGGGVGCGISSWARASGLQTRGLLHGGSSGGGGGDAWDRGLRTGLRRRKGGYMALSDGGSDGDGNNNGNEPQTWEGRTEKKNKKEGWWSILVVGVESISRLYVPVSDMNVLGELDVKSFAAARHGLDGVWEEGMELDEL